MYIIEFNYRGNISQYPTQHESKINIILNFGTYDTFKVYEEGKIIMHGTKNQRVRMDR